jgi:lysophospholipase L1-like esterase
MAGGTPKDKYEAGLKDIIGRVKAAGARVILCTPSVIGEKPDGTNERDTMLDEYADISRKVAAETGVQLNDLRKAFLAYEKDNNKEDKPKGVLTGDGVHLNPAGNKLVAGQMLQALGIKAEPAEAK